MNRRDDKATLRGQPLGDGWYDLGPLSQWPSDRGLYAQCAELALAVFLVEDRIYAVADTCPHAHASLSSGTLQRGCVVCPGHAWMFDLETGQCLDDPRYPARTFPARITRGRVHVQVS